MSSYTKQDFQSGDILFAEQLNTMETQIYQNTEDINSMKAGGGVTSEKII